MQSGTPPTPTATGTPLVRIEKLVYGGEGLGRIDGQIVLMPFVLPEEEVSVATQQVKRGLLRGSALTVLEPSPERIIPRCEYFGTCGGCHYQHAAYAFELEQKRQILLETLLRGSGVRYQDEIRIISGDPWFYRNRIQLHFFEDKSGFHQAASHRLCAIDHCYIASPVLVEVIAAFRKAVARPEWPAFLRSLEVFTNGNEIQLTVVDTARPVAARFFEWCRQFLPSSTGDPISYSTAGFDFRISRKSFFQVNRHLIEALVEEVNGNVEGEEAIDLYSGVGLFSLPLSRRFRTVTAVEPGGSAFHDLEWNTAQAGTNIQVARASALEFLVNLQETPDLVVADPPRAGLGPDVTGELLRLRPGKLVLVSCDPATMARDVKRLLTAYRIERITLVDLFPRTFHFETVVHMQREATG